jgi:hypothetical protein
MLAQGQPVRDIEDTLRADDGRRRLPRTAVSELVCPLVDGFAAAVRPGQRREPAMAAWGFTATGRGSRST